ncbi:MAG: aminoglycoside phosphotransferase family protein [Methylococcaceae bacterium]|nr:aminoglycoside phosphotransferase family protein [Methylococcaceae bacterium]
MIASIEAGAESLFQHMASSPDWQWESKILSETPGHRLVTHYLIRTTNEKHRSNIIETVGKFYEDDAMGVHCYNTMCAIHGLLATRVNPPLAIPEPIFYSPDNKLLTLKWVDHRPYSELINSRYYKHYLRLVGKALAYFHHLPMEYGQFKNIDDHLRELIMPHPLALAELLPRQAIRIQRIVHRLCEIEQRLVQHTISVPIHRDFHLRQLFCDGRKVWLIDWDMYGLGDPALDVGNFLVYLATRIPAKSKSAGAAFLEGYQSLMPNVSEANIRLYEALTYLRLACKAYRLQLQDWEIRAEEYLTQSENKLLMEN